MNPIEKISVNDKVRSFDFGCRDLTGERACYMEGVVTKVMADGEWDYPAYEIEVKRMVSGGKERTEFPDTIYPPINGTEDWIGMMMNNVVVLKTDDIVWG